MSESVILEEDIDENYEPTQQEIEEYAHFLQMDLPEDNDLLWIAKEGLKAPLPEPWKPCKTRDDEIYYFNFETGESTWEHPCDDYYRKQYLAHKGQKSNKQASVKKKRLPDPTLAFDFVESSVGKKIGSPIVGGFKGFDDKEKDPVLKFEMEKKLKKEKQEMEERYSAEVSQVNKEFEDKRASARRNYERELDMLRKQDAIRREESELELKRWLDLELEKAKSAARRDFESEESAEKGKVQSDHQRELQRISDEFAMRLNREQQKLKAQQAEERDSLLQSEESVKMSEIRRLTTEIEKTQARLEAAKAAISNKERKNGGEIAAAELQAEREIADTMSRLRAENDMKLAAEKRTAEERFQRETERLRSQTGEDSKKSVASLQQLEQEIKNEMTVRLKKVETEAEIAFHAEKEKIQLDYISKMRQMMETEVARGKSALSQEIDAYRLKVQHDIAQEKLSKETENNTVLLEFKRRLGQELEIEQNRVQEELRSRLRNETVGDKSDLRSKVLRLKQELADVKREVENIEREGVRLSDAINEVQRQVPVQSVPETPQVDPGQLSRLEKEMDTLKQLLLRKESISPIPCADPVPSELANWRTTLQREKQEVKEQQKTLEMDRERWRLEVRQYEMNPGSRSRIELQNVKKALDAKTRKLNEKVHELRTTEKWLQRQEAGKSDKTLDFEIEDDVSERKLTENEQKDSIFELSDDLVSADRGRGAPVGYYQATDATMMSKLQQYDRQLGSYGARREQARGQIAKVDTWVTSAKDELRGYGTPGRDFLP